MPLRRARIGRHYIDPVSIRLILNSNADGVAVLHREDCQTIQHQVRGDLREELPGGGYLVLESYDDGTALVGPNDETYRSYYEAQYVTVADLSRGRHYRRCKVCAPDAPEPEPDHLHMTRKRASSLNAADLDRRCVDGIIKRIEHTAAGTSVTLEGGRTISFGPEESIAFPRTQARPGTEPLSPR